MSLDSKPAFDEDFLALRERGSHEACARIVAAHGSLVKSACLRILRDEAMAQDAAQETFVLLVKKAKSLPAGASLAGWLYHAAVRTALNHLRTSRRRREREQSLEAMSHMMPDQNPDVWSEMEPLLDEAMLSLPPRQRDLVVQCYFNNESQRSAAAGQGCSESVVSRELRSAIESLRQFFSKRGVVMSVGVMTSHLSGNVASAAMTGTAATVAAMVAECGKASTLLASLLQSKLALGGAAALGVVAMTATGFHLASSPREGSGSGSAELGSGQGYGGAAAGGDASGAQAKATAAKGADGKSARAGSVGSWDSNFKFTSALALEELKKQVLLESDADARFALLQKMGVKLSRAAFDALIAQGMDASVAPWRDTLAVLANRTEMFDNYLMAWSNEDPVAALDWVSSQPGAALALRKQLLYVLESGQLSREALNDWLGGLEDKTMRHESLLALQWMENPSSLIAKLGTGDNDGFLVDLAMLGNGDNLDWRAFGQRLGEGKSAIVARAIRLAMDGTFSQAHLYEMIAGLERSPDPNIHTGATTILRAVLGDKSVNYAEALRLALQCDAAGMSDFTNQIFKGWASADPAAAMQHSGNLLNLARMREVMRSLPTVPDEGTLLSWMAGTPQKAQDIALAFLYGLTADGPEAQLERILQSPHIMDQVEATKEVMRMSPLKDATSLAEWLRQLPAGDAKTEITFALSRQLAAANPQAALDLILGSDLRGKEYVMAVSSAVTQFAAQNDIASSTRFIQKIADPAMYAESLGQVAMVKFAGRPQEAFAYLQANARGEWQTAALRMLSDQHYNKLGNIDANAAEFLKLDLPRLGSEVPKRASLLCKVWIDHQAALEKPLAWTQQLPPAMAREARLQLAKNRDLKPVTIQQYLLWTQTAKIQTQERTQLQKLLAKNPGSAALR